MCLFGCVCVSVSVCISVWVCVCVGVRMCVGNPFSRLDSKGVPRQKTPRIPHGICPEAVLQGKTKNKSNTDSWPRCLLKPHGVGPLVSLSFQKILLFTLWTFRKMPWGLLRGWYSPLPSYRAETRASTQWALSSFFQAIQAASTAEAAPASVCAKCQPGWLFFSD